MRIGTGYDVHRLSENRELILGGVKIPYEKGLIGYSDADVLVHAVMDALLGAAALGDIGQLFPDTNPEYKDISSLELLKRVRDVLEDKCYLVENIDATIIAQKPKLASYLPEMVRKIAAALGIEEDCINIKATTEEGLGFTGKGLGIAANSVCLIESMRNYQYDVTPCMQQQCVQCEWYEKNQRE
jgi:2-C-methyl-D-erythritol 2,4-cyclodiphosphate synthase